MQRLAMIATLLGATAVTAARADVVDQSYIPVTGQGFNTGSSSNRPLGQEFTPTLGSLDFVDLYIGDAGSDAGPGATFLLNIRAGSILGAILGTSNSVFVADNTNLGVGSYANFIVTRFTFASPVALTPGATGVIEIVQQSPPANFAAYGGPLSASTYAGGRAIVGGLPQANFDFAFREGLTTAAIPEPSPLALAAVLASAGGACVVRRRSRP